MLYVDCQNAWEIHSLSSAKLSAAENRLLAALPRKDRLQFLSGCDLVDLEFPEIIYEPQPACLFSHRQLCFIRRGD